MGYIREAEHYDLYLQFLAGIGIDEETAAAHLPNPGTIGAASTMGYYCRNSFEEGLGAFGLAVEMEVPGRPNGAKFLYDGLRRHYGFDEKTLEFWAVHVNAEEEHGENAVEALRRFAQTREQQALIRRAFRFSVLAHAAMSEGYDRYLDRAAA
jgi:pyrroloquinoline quinone (PQQ) biosynthesis protein C